MWLCTRYGFFSAVCARQGDGRKSEAVDTDRIMVRARIRSHLESLKAEFPALLEGVEIRESATTDYRFRIFVDKTEWAQVALQLTMDIDYDNFKSAVAARLGTKDPYEGALHRVWGVFYGMQERDSGPGIYSKDRAPRAVPASGYDGFRASLFDGVEDVEVDDDSEAKSEEPRDEELVVVCRKVGSGEAFGVIWWPDEFFDGAEAYTYAADAEALPRYDENEVEFEFIAWGVIKSDGLPVFNVDTAE